MDPGLMMLLASLASGAMGAFGGEKGEFKSGYSKGQQGGINDLLDMVKNMRGGADITQNPTYQAGNEWLQSMFSDPDFFKSFEAPMQRQFEEQTVPDLANRFASMGSGGATGSTGFRNQLGREGSNLQTNMAALRGQMQQNAIPQMLGYSNQPFQNMMSMYGQALGSPMNNAYQPASMGGFGAMAGPLAGGAAQYWGGQYGQQNKVTGQSPSTM